MTNTFEGNRLRPLNSVKNLTKKLNRQARAERLAAKWEADILASQAEAK